LGWNFCNNFCAPVELVRKKYDVPHISFFGPVFSDGYWKVYIVVLTYLLYMTQRCWCCDRVLELSDIVRKCISCHHGVCSHCFKLKVGTGERFVCAKCEGNHPYTLRDRPISIKPLVIPDTDLLRFWAVLDEKSEDILYVKLDDEPTLAYNRHISYIVKLADRLYDANIYISNVYLDDDLQNVYPQAHIKLGGSTRKTLEWQRYDMTTRTPRGVRLRRDYGHGWLGNIEVIN